MYKSTKFEKKNFFFATAHAREGLKSDLIHHFL